MQVFFIECIVILLWVIYGYSLAFSEGGAMNAFVGGFSKAFLAGITPDTNAETFSDGVVIPEYVYICFQMTFAAITPALIVGSMAERMKFSAIVLFIPLWATFVYFPIAHIVWYWAGPGATVAAAKALAAAAPDAKAAAQAAVAGVRFRRTDGRHRAGPRRRCRVHVHVLRGEERHGLRRCARRVRRALHRRHPGRAGHRHPGGSLARRHRCVRLRGRQGWRLRYD